MSASQDVNDWKSRKIVEVEMAIPGVADSLCFLSGHFGWWNDAGEPLEGQIRRLAARLGSSPTILAGDFNTSYDTTGYRFVVDTLGVSDVFALDPANDPSTFTLIPNAGAVEKSAGTDGTRIDYIFTRNLEAKVLHSRRIFTPEDGGLVSDHVGVTAGFERGGPTS